MSYLIHDDNNNNTWKLLLINDNGNNLVYVPNHIILDDI